MLTDSPTTGYFHRQRAPLCLLVYVLAIPLFLLGWLIADEPLIRWLFPPIGLLMMGLAASFHHLTVRDEYDRLAIRFGPLPLFRRTVRYDDIAAAEVGRTQAIDGWGIHYSLRGGWVWNIWGRECVVVRFKDGGTLWIGTNDGENLAAFLSGKIAS